MVYRNLVLAKQHGVVLIAALIMVIVVSGIAVTLMSSSSVDMKVINAAQDYDEALTLAYADNSRAIYQEIKVNDADNFMTPNLGTEDQTISLVVSNATGALSLTKAPGVLSPTNCSRKRSAHATNAAIKCSRDLRLRSSITYGKNGRHSLSVVSGIEQESL